MKASLFGQGSALAICAVASLWGASAYAQDDSEVSEVVVTGSFIAGTPEDAALPVDVIGADEMQRQGNPTTVEMMKRLTVSGGVLGDQNQYATTFLTIAGIATVNLRNLGPQRTLVLLNGKRVATFPTRNGSVDLNTMPQAAIGRIEVLKDGAAATYGSDAIGGVVNFITRKNFNGLEVAGDVRYVADADNPDYSTSATWGWSGDNGNVLLSAAYQYRGRLRANERDFNSPTYLQNPDAGFSTSNNPSSFIPLIGAGVLTSGAQIRDPGCATVGAQPGFLNATVNPATGAISGGVQGCFARLAGVTVNLVDPSSRFQLYGETNFDLSDTVKFHAEALYAETYTTQLTSPYPSLLQGPTAATSPVPGQYYVPASNPGLALLIQQFPNAFPANTTGVRYSGGSFPFRPFGLGGSSQFDNGPTQITVDIKTYRVSGGFSGKLFDDAIGWDVSSTYQTINYKQTGWDYLVNRQELALRGFGSLGGDTNGCTSAETANFTTNAGNNALGCYYFNPFSNSYARNATVYGQNDGVANPLFNPAVANNPELVKWLFQKQITDATSRIFVVDGVLNGELPIEFAGGKVGWAAGGQFRRQFYRTDYSPFFNAAVTPCADTPITGSTNCLAPIGPFALQAAIFPSNVVQNVYAGFGEVSLPFTDDFSAHIAARYENYGEDGGGDTFNPKLDLRWQALDWLALRGSVGTTFRAPPLTLLDPAKTATQVSLNNVFRPVFTAGNSDLSPEKATTYSVGAIVEAGIFKGTIDYWAFDFTDPFVTEPVSTLFNLMFPNNTNVNCNSPAFADIQARFSFSSGACSANDVSAVNVSYVNSGGIKTDGVDITGDLSFDDVYGGNLKTGAQLTYVNKYLVAEQKIRGVTIAPAFDAVGKFNYGTAVFPLPRWKAVYYAEWDSGPHNLRVQTNFASSYTDQRTTPYGGFLYTGDVATSNLATATPRPQDGKKIKAWMTTDVTYRVFLPWDTTAVLNVNNIFDTDPPLARVELNYDASVASGLGRTVKLALTKKF